MRFPLPILALAAIAVPAAAAPATEVETVTVRVDYADIDLGTDEGRATLEARIDAELEQACTVAEGSRYAYGRSIVDETCIADARAAALAEVERIAAAAARGGREVAAN